MGILNLQLSAYARAEILHQKAKFLKDGYLIFNRMSIGLESRSGIKLYLNNIEICTLKTGEYLAKGNTLDICFSEDDALMMKVKLN